MTNLKRWNQFLLMGPQILLYDKTVFITSKNPRSIKSSRYQASNPSHFNFSFIWITQNEEEWNNKLCYRSIIIHICISTTYQRWHNPLIWKLSTILSSVNSTVVTNLQRSFKSSRYQTSNPLHFNFSFIWITQNEEE